MSQCFNLSMSSRDDDPKTSAGGPAARAADTFIDERDGFGPDAPTEADVPSGGEAPDVDARPRELADLGYERYEPRRELGKGGMGVVDLCFDRQIGREVAVKVLLPNAAKRRSSRDRFLREARVQAQLEHPGVVPVYDLGVTPGGQPYFAMKRVRGTTLLAALVGLWKGEPGFAERYPRRALLSVIERVCEAVAYAHARGVVHRDLKPANIMIGDFGEVNVLDWGIAKLRSDSDLSDPASDDDDVPDFTVPGSIVGSAGYMSPEQASGEEADERADVYALGTILFESCTHQMLHRGTYGERLRSTIEGVDARPSARLGDPDFPEELDAICEKATAPRDERYPNAGALLADLRAFLEGQRSAELRREVATQHAEAARVSLAGGRVSASETVRVQALRQLGAAAVLDPENREMIGMIERLLAPQDDTEQMPEEVEASIAKDRRESARVATGRSALAYAAGMMALPILGWMGVRDWTLFSVFAAALIASGVGAALLWRSREVSTTVVTLSAPMAFGTLALFSAVFGPFFLVPGLASATAVAFMISQRAEWQLRGVVNVCSAASVLVPFGLQQLGWMPASVRFVDGGVQVLPHLVDFPPVPTTVLLFFGALFIALVPNILVGRAIEALNRSERRQLLLTHRLRSMLPG